MSSGLRLRPAEQVLVSRARDFLTAGPSDAVDLIAHVCQLPGPPRSVAEHMAMALLAPWEEFKREVDGRWNLTTDGAPGVAVSPPARRSEDELADLSYVVVDVETTGGSIYGGDRITEIAAVVVKRGAITRVYESLVNPQRPISPMVTRLTNITWSMVRRAPTFRDIVADVADALRGHVFVAHNAGFDWRFVTREIERATGERLEGRRVCTVKMARAILPQLHRRSLDHLARFYGVENRARHRAGGDAMATAHVFLAMMKEARSRGCVSWADLESLLRIVPRGKRRRRRSAMPRFIDRDTTA